MGPIQVITIDLDDTLWEIHPVIRRAEQALHDWIAREFPAVGDRYSREALMIFRQEILHEFPHKAHDYTYLRRKVLSRAGKSCGCPDDFVDRAMEIFDRERNAVDIFPEVIPTLEYLRDHYRLIAVTNGNARLDMIGIDHLFDDLISAREAGAAKPSPQIFQRAVEAGGASVAETLHVGDDPDMDVVGAQEIGMRAVWVNRNEGDWPQDLAPPDHEVRHVGELPAWLERWRDA